MASSRKRLKVTTADHACAFCPGFYCIAEDGAGVPCVIHSKPHCEAFGLLDCEHFVTVCRLAWEHLRGHLPPVKGGGAA